MNSDKLVYRHPKTWVVLIWLAALVFDTITPGNQGNRSGPVDPASWPARSEADIDAMNRVVPLQREGVDSECGDPALYLCSPLASYISGAVLPVDGGTWAAGGWVRGRDRKWTLNGGFHPAHDRRCRPRIRFGYLTKYNSWICGLCP